MITITFRDKAEGKKVFDGDDCRVDHQPDAVVITDKWGGKHHYPIARVFEVEESAPPRSSW
jgi:hypothetical protein